MLTVHRAERGDTLAAALGAVLRTPLADPFAEEVVAVPARGVERWLAQRLSHVLGAGPGGEDGVAAGLRFPSPAQVADRALDAALPEGVAERWAPERVVWDVLATLDECGPDQAWCAALGAHLGLLTGAEDETRQGRRYAVAQRVARHLSAYAASRPELVHAWAAGDDAGVPDDLAWQPELWRRVRARADVPSPAEVLAEACARLRAEPSLADLPERLSLFGVTRMTRSRLAVVAALAEHRDVHVWLHHPSPGAWARTAAAAGRAPGAGRGAGPGPGPGGAPRRRDDPTAQAVAHPLLASLGRDVRELQLLLREAAPGHADAHHPGAPLPPTLLGRLQAALRDDEAPGPPARLDPDDRSVQVHACHGRARQVEVLREAVLGLLADDPTLEPRDVLVLCPDVEAFAPLVDAAFGGDDPVAHPAARLRVRLADRAPRRTNPLLAVLTRLLELADGRLTASDVLDLAGAPAVRRRWGLDDGDLDRLRAWVAAAGTRWGLDAEHRGRWRLGGLGQGTWDAGLDRLLLGVAMEEGDDWLGHALPLDDVDSGDVDLAGRWAELVDRLAAAVRLLAGRRPLPEWLPALEEALLGLAAPEPDAAWQAGQLRAELDELRASADPAVPLGLADLRALLDGRLQGRPTRAGFRTGTLTVCTLVPMRSVPHRVVCLLGLDDGAFPRQTVPDGDDLLARDPRAGERDPRSEDRQLLLDAVMAAQEHLVVTYDGADERTGQVRPPAVPLGELLDALDATSRPPDGRRTRDEVVVRHPLQPFDARCFTPGRLGRRGAFSHDRHGLAGARAAAGPRTPGAPLLAAPLPPASAGDVELDDLLRMLEHPARGFLRQRLGVTVPRDEEEPEDALPVELDGLDRWAVGDRVLRGRLAGLDADTCRGLEWRRGALPPGPLGAGVLADVAETVDELLAATETERGETARSVDVVAALPGGRRVLGTVPGVRGDAVVAVTWSRLAAKHRLRAWVQLVTLSAADPDRSWTAVTAGRRTGGVTRSRLGPLAPALATEVLAQLVALHDAGLRSPLPLPVATAAAYAVGRGRGDDAPAAAATARPEWEGDRDRGIPGERADAEQVLLHGPAAPLSALLAERPGDDERGPGWAADETTRLGVLARRVWDRLLEHERTERS